MSAEQKMLIKYQIVSIVQLKVQMDLVILSRGLQSMAYISMCSRKLNREQVRL